MNQHDSPTSRQTPPARLTRYGLALSSTALAALARWLLPAALTPAPYLGFYPAVVVSAALGGVGPGLVATFSSLLLVNFVFGRFNLHDHGAMARQVIWVAASVGVSLLAGMQRTARMREHRQAEELRRLNDELELRVEERTAEIREANRQLSNANEKLAELDRAKTSFFGNVSHEFRTPLMLMLGPLEESLAGADISPEQRQQLEIAHRNSLRLLKLVNTLLDFSRIEAGRVQATYEPLDLALYTADLASLFRSAIEKAGMELVVECPPLPEPVFVDRDMWEKIVLNLLSNAFKFTEQGRIRVRLGVVGGLAELAVEDTGCGIPAAQLDNVFKRFHRIEGVRGRSHEGSGIGLALVQELARLHGGDVRVESSEGSGSTFRVSIPFGRHHLPAERILAESSPAPASIGANAYLAEALHWLPDAGRTENAVAGAHPAPASASAPRPAVLLADDNADMREYVRRILSASYEVRTVADGEAALAAARRQTPDLVLSDIMMPGLDGFGLLAALRAAPETSAVPVIFLSARAGEESRVEGLEAGADDYLVKPFGGRELLARVRSNLELARMRGEAARREQEALDTARLFEAVRESEGRLRRAEEMAHLGHWRYDLATGRVSWSGEIHRIFGLQGEEPQPERSLDEIMKLCHPDDREQVARAFDPSGLHDGGAFEYRIVRPDGRERHVVSNGELVRDDSGRLTALFGTLLDTTEIRQKERELQEKNAELERFSYMISHDLKSPLVTVKTFLGYLERDLADNDAGRIEKDLHYMRTAADRMERLLAELLEMSRIGRMANPPVPVSCSDLIAEALNLVAGPIAERGVEVLASAPDTTLFGDHPRLVEIWQNLLENACKFMGDQAHPRIELGAQGSGRKTLFFVRDNGVGIEPQYQDKVFGLFEKLDHCSEGTGLGLALVKRIVELNGGEIRVESRGRGQGACFSFTLPLAFRDNL